MLKDNAFVSLWKPLEEISYEILDLNNINFSGDTLTISLCDDKHDYVFTFEELISNCGSFKYTATMHNLEFNDKIGYWYEKCGISGKSYPLLILYASDYLESIKQQSYHAFTNTYKELRHYVFITYDAVIEVVSVKEPHCFLAK